MILDIWQWLINAYLETVHNTYVDILLYWKIRLKINNSTIPPSLAVNNSWNCFITLVINTLQQRKQTFQGVRLLIRKTVSPPLLRNELTNGVCLLRGEEEKET